MAIAVELPKLGNTVEECIVAKWCKKKGDAVAPGDLVAEIETDKATFELTAPVEGTILATFFDEGALVPVFTNLFVIGTPGENVDPFKPELIEPLATETDAPAVSRATTAVSSPVAPSRTSESTGVMSPRARRFADDHDFHPASIRGSGPGGRVLEEDVRRAYYSSPRVSGAAKRRMESGAEIRGEGTGPAGMLLAADLGAAGTRLSSMREKIARHMRESLANTAQYTLNGSAIAAGLVSLRARFKARAETASININDLITFCTIQALRDIPDLNAELIDGKIYRHADIHIGFACETPRGLVVPVVRDAGRLPITDLSRRMKELAAQAVEGRIAPDDLSGGTFTVSNLGSLGVESFTPLLNAPQVAILGVGSLQLKPVRRDGNVEFVDVIGLSLTCDHQVIDGAPGAKFLQVLKEKIENVESLCTI
jgi:pyruvate dehydrogenase E2 component (dihydrolipoamide acetyltransferase)